MLKKVAFTMYPITNVPRARDFYENKLGLKIGSHGNRGDRWWVEYDLPGGGCFALTNFTEEEPSAGAGGNDRLRGGRSRCSDRRPEIEGGRVQERHHSQPPLPHGGLPRQRRQLDPFAPTEAGSGRVGAAATSLSPAAKRAHIGIGGLLPASGIAASLVCRMACVASVR